MSGVKVLLAAVACCVLQCSARSLNQVTVAPAQAAPDVHLHNQTVQGVADFLQSNANYSSFLSFVHLDPIYSKLLSGAWSQGATNNTVLVPTNAAIDEGFQQLANQYDAPSNPGHYLMLANSSMIGSNYTATPLNTALAQLFSAMLNSHIFTTPMNLYANRTVFAASETTPLVLPSLGLDNTFATEVYNNGTITDPALYLSQPTGLLKGDIAVPMIYAQQTGANAQGVRFSPAGMLALQREYTVEASA